MATTIFRGEDYLRYLQHGSNLSLKSQKTYFGQIRVIAEKFREILQIELFDLIQQCVTLDPSLDLLDSSLRVYLEEALLRLYTPKSKEWSNSRSYFRMYFNFLVSEEEEIEQLLEEEDLQEEDYEKEAELLTQKELRTIPEVLSIRDLSRRLRQRLCTQDRVYDGLIIPNRLLASLNKVAMSNWCDDCLDNLEICSSEGILKLADIGRVFIQSDGRVLAQKWNGSLAPVFTPLAKGDEKIEMRVMKFRFVHIDHTEGLQSVALKALKEGRLPALSQLTEMLKGLNIQKASDMVQYKPIKEALLKHPEYSPHLIAQAIKELGELTKKTGLRLMEATENLKKNKR